MTAVSLRGGLIFVDEATEVTLHRNTLGGWHIKCLVTLGLVEHGVPKRGANPVNGPVRGRLVARACTATGQEFHARLEEDRSSDYRASGTPKPELRNTWLTIIEFDGELEGKEES